MPTSKRVAIIGAGWSGLAAAIEATTAGHQVTVYEAARTLGGRARAVEATLPDGQTVQVDNGQHILIGAYTHSLELMRKVGMAPSDTLHEQPLALIYPNGCGLRLPDLPVPLDALTGILGQRAWPLRERLGLLRVAATWKWRRFRCAPELSVSDLCRPLGPHVMAQLIEPLCVSALNTPASRASAQVFLRVLRDALFGVRGGSHLLLPKVDLSALFPEAAASWLAHHGAQIRRGTRVGSLQCSNGQWRCDAETYDAVLLACPSTEASRLVRGISNQTPGLSQWAASAEALQFEPIATVYAWGHGIRLPEPMLALHPDAEHPAQFVFDRGQLGGPAGLLAFVISASRGDRETLQAQVLEQARQQLGHFLQGVLTVVEKRATFACTPALQRPGPQIAPGLLACGDYVEGPYPATIEGAVRGGQLAAGLLSN